MLLSACSGRPTSVDAPGLQPPTEASPTPFLPAPATTTPQVARVWISPAVPTALRRSMELVVQGLDIPVELAVTPETSDLRLEPGGEGVVAEWTYAVVAPFPSLPDSISTADLEAAWQDSTADAPPVFVDSATRSAMEAVLGAAGDRVRVLEDPETLLEFAWSSRPSLAIVPFDALDVRWKVLGLDGNSPIGEDFDPQGYPLKVRFGLSGEPAIPEAVLAGLETYWGQSVPLANRRSDRMTVVVMTGVTALVRATAWQIDREGVGFPARDVGAWLRSADITHVSNEVAFTPDCPPAEPQATNLIFCSSPSHAELLAEVGVDVIELTGNHVLDAGPQAFLYSLDLYREQGWAWFGGGADLAQSRQPALFDHNGNRIAFVGCNEAGPPSAWAADGRPGANPCGVDRLRSSLADLRRQGYLPIATFQWHEHYTPVPPASQREAFRGAADAGAVAVSGSQAHQPQGFEFRQGAFIHYGPGNLFFDQMWSTRVRQEFIDRYIFHQGRLISVELLTAYLEDWSRPRPMTPDERLEFLEDIFRASGW